MSRFAFIKDVVRVLPFLLLVGCYEGEAPRLAMPLYDACIAHLPEIKRNLESGGYDFELRAVKFESSVETLPGLAGVLEVTARRGKDDLSVVEAEFRAICMPVESIRVDATPQGWSEMQAILNHAHGQNYLVYRDGKLVLYSNSFPDRKYPL